MLFMIIFLFVVFTGIAFADCTTIKDGSLLTSTGEFIETGFDEYGYNYQARMFNGLYTDSDRVHGHGEFPELEGITLIMKWNDAWLSNKDCGPLGFPDGNLDRHNGFVTYQGSGAWLTNHQKGFYRDEKGKKQRWEYFIKIVAAPAGATRQGDIDIGFSWYDTFNVLIGPDIWGQFVIIQEVSNDTSLGEHGILYKSPYSVGFGNYGPQN